MMQRLIVLASLAGYACALPPGGLTARTAGTRGSTSDICPVSGPAARTYVVLGLFSWGDSSTETAKALAADLKISRVCEINVRTRTFLGTGYVETKVRGAIR